MSFFCLDKRDALAGYCACCWERDTMDALLREIEHLSPRERNEIYAYMLGMLAHRKPLDFAIAREMAERHFELEAR